MAKTINPSLDKHPGLSISSYYGLRDCETKETRWFANRSVRSELNHAVRTHFINCPECGGLIPELEIQDKERSLRFTCTQIIEDGKTLAQTDYAKLLRYLLADHLINKEHITKKDLDSSLRDFILKLTKEEKEGIDMVQTSNSGLDKHLEYSTLSPRGKTKIEKNRGKPLVCDRCNKPIDVGEPIKFSSGHNHCYHAFCYESLLIECDEEKE